MLALHIQILNGTDISYGAEGGSGCRVIYMYIYNIIK